MSPNSTELKDSTDQYAGKARNREMLARPRMEHDRLLTSHMVGHLGPISQGELVNQSKPTEHTSCRA